MNELPKDVSQSAAEKVRLQFNPSGYDTAQNIKVDAARLITTIERLLSPSREASMAITEIEAGAMWAVKAATAPKA